MERAPKGREARAIALVAGTSIGGGMLGSPVLTAEAGFFPSLVVYTLSVLLMISSGLLLLEVCLWMKRETNFVSMAERTLGGGGSLFAWCCYLFLFYCLNVAYLVGGGKFLAELLDLPPSLGPLSFVLLFGPMIYLGAWLVGRVNALLVVGLMSTFFLFLLKGVGHIQVELLGRANWSAMWGTFPIAFTAFGFQGIVPTLAHYLKNDQRAATRAILLGSGLAWLATVTWQALIMGIVPFEGLGGLREAFLADHNAVQPLEYALQDPRVYTIGRWFAFFALTTSFLGVTLPLRDFLADGLGWKKSPSRKLLLCGLIFLPTLAITAVNPSIFLRALGLAGGVGVALLLVLLPILMAWVLRYRRGEERRILPGGKPLLFLLFILVLWEVGSVTFW